MIPQNRRRRARLPTIDGSDTHITIQQAYASWHPTSPVHTIYLTSPSANLLGHSVPENREETKPAVSFEKATQEDIRELTRIMKRAFDDEAIRFKGDPKGGGPPGYDDGSFLTKWGLTGNGQHQPGSLIKILVDTDSGRKPVGAFIVFVGNRLGRPGSNVLGTIFVDPDWQNLKVGSQAMDYILAEYPAKRWQLGTPEWATRNQHFYEKNGFVKIRQVWDPELDEEKGGAFSYIYEKIMKS